MRSVKKVCLIRLACQSARSLTSSCLAGCLSICLSVHTCVRPPCDLPSDQRSAQMQVTLKLIETFVDKCEDLSVVTDNLVPAMMEPILRDYARNVPDARCCFFLPLLPFLFLFLLFLPLPSFLLLPDACELDSSVRL